VNIEAFVANGSYKRDQHSHHPGLQPAITALAASSRQSPPVVADHPMISSGAARSREHAFRQLDG
jgi:hypothetical protein